MESLNRLGQLASKCNWNSISNLRSDVRLRLAVKNEIISEGLQPSGFQQRNRPILFCSPAASLGFRRKHQRDPRGPNLDPKPTHDIGHGE